jgi:putative glutamine amidotransferase
MNGPIIGITTDIDDEYLKIKHHYSDAILKAGGNPVLIPTSDNAKFFAEILDGLLIPGGDDLDPSYYNEDMLSQVKPVPRMKSDFEICLLNEIVLLNKPVLGICYGMQLINVAFGGTLHQDINSQISVEINHKNGYHIIVITENRFLTKGTFSVNSTHHQAVKKLGKNLSAFAFSPDNLIEAFYREDYPFLIGVQWHPERLINNELSLNIFKSFVGASSDSK